MAPLLADLQFRGLVHQMSDEALTKMLDEEQLTAYIGFDPTSDSLQIGNLLQLCNLRRLQVAGHRPIVLAGGGTGMIGDPGGKSEERPLLDRERLEENLAGIRPQLEKFLDFSPGAGAAQALLLDNSEWLGSYSLISFLRDIGKHFTVGQMIAKDSVRTRMDRPEQGISYAEFSYMLLQAADFLHLYDHFGCQLQMGASDQWGNITMGVELIRKVRQGTAYALTSPLVLRADGSKFGKSDSQGTLYLSASRTSPWALYQFFVRVEDSVVGTYLRYFTFLDHDELSALDEETASHPERRAAQRRLAEEIVGLVHSAADATRIEHAASVLYTEDVVSLDEATLLMVCEDVPSTTVARSALADGLDLLELVVGAGLFDSRSKARTALEQGGLYVNNRRVDPAASSVGLGDLIADRFVLLRRGRRDFHLLRCS